MVSEFGASLTGGEREAVTFSLRYKLFLKNNFRTSGLAGRVMAV